MEDKPKEILELERALGIGSVSIYNIEYGKLVSLAIFGENLQDITPISALKQLTSLDLTYNKISDISPLKKLKRLTHLDLTNNKISDISPLRTLHALNLLHASGNQISDLSPLQALNDLTLLDLAKNKITDLSHLNKLIGLKRLHLSRNKISDLTPLKKLTHLTSLYLSNNQISIVLPLQELFNLTTLDLSNNHISDIYPLIEIIKKGLKLSLKENDYTNNSIRLNGNPVSIPPLEIVEKGNKAVLDYFDDLEKYGEFEILEGKLLIVGEPKAGKTTLRKKIFDPEYPVPCKEEKETIGVQILKGWEFPYLEDQAKIFTANIWDFGGQERQYPLHQFFMDDVSCYVLVSDDRADNSNMDKWFGMIKLLGGTHSNVLVILNQINRSTPSSNFNKERYEKQGFKVETFSIDFSNDSHNISDLLENIQNRLCNLQHVGQKLPKKICEPIRNEILRLKNDEQKNYLTIEEFHTACQRVDLKNTEEQIKALKYLKSIGDVVHFDDDILDNIIILNPTWLTQAIYAIITCEELDEFHKKGIFDRHWFYDFMEKTTDTKTTSYSNAECKHILNFMLKNNMDICYKSGDNIFIVPMCMPEKLPEYQFNENGGLVVIYQYESIPPGLISRLIVRMSDYIENNLVAKNASIFSKNNARAKLDEYFKEKGVFHFFATY